MKLDQSKLRISTFNPELTNFMVRTERGVSIYYPPTGHIIEECDERSQHRNRQKALERMQLAVADEIVPKICKVIGWNGRVCFWTVVPAYPPRSSKTAQSVLIAREARWAAAYVHANRLNVQEECK